MEDKLNLFRITGCAQRDVLFDGTRIVGRAPFDPRVLVPDCVDLRIDIAARSPRTASSQITAAFVVER